MHQSICIFKEFHLLSHQQYRFWPNSATARAVEHINSNLSITIENELYTRSVFLDLSQACDAINHEIVLQKLFLLCYKRGPFVTIFQLSLNRKQKYQTLSQKYFLRGPFSCHFSLLCKQIVQVSPLYFVLMIHAFVYMIKIRMTCNFLLTVNFLK